MGVSLINGIVNYRTSSLSCSDTAYRTPWSEPKITIYVNGDLSFREQDSCWSMMTIFVKSTLCTENLVWAHSASWTIYRASVWDRYHRYIAVLVRLTYFSGARRLKDSTGLS